MGRIKNQDKYPIKSTPVAKDYVLGSDSEDNGKTVNFEVGSLTGEGNTVQDDNQAIEINFGFTADADLSTIVSTVNNLPSTVEVTYDEIPVIVGIVPDPSENSVSYRRVYMVKGKGKGTYGSGGTITVAASDLLLISEQQIGTFPDPIINDPSAVVEDLGEIGATALEDVVNASSPALVIGAGENWYFEFTRSGSRYLYGFTGAAGIYGLGQTQTVAGDFFLIYDETFVPVVTATSQLINDGSDSTSTYVETDELGAVAFDNDYNSLSNLPTIPDTPTGLEVLDEGNGNGWRLIGRTAVNYGNIGLNSIDFSFNGAASSTAGNTGDYGITSGGGYFDGEETTTEQINAGDYSVVSGAGNQNFANEALVSGRTNTNNIGGDRSSISGLSNINSGTNSIISGNSHNNSGDDSAVVGQNNINSGNRSLVSGTNQDNSGINSVLSGGGHINSGSTSDIGGEFNNNTAEGAFIRGSLNTNSGLFASSLGIGLLTKSFGEVQLGSYGTDYVAASAIVFDTSDRMLNVGIGATSSTRADGFTVMKNALVLAPSLTEALIDGEVTGKVLITKEWYEAQTINGFDYTAGVVTLGEGADGTPVTFDLNEEGAFNLRGNAQIVQIATLDLYDDDNTNYTRFNSENAGGGSVEVPAGSGRMRVASQVVNDQTGTSYTVVQSDAEDKVVLNNASPVTVDVEDAATEPILEGTEIRLINKGAGTVTVNATAGVTINTALGGLTIPQYGVRTLVKISTPDEWILY